MAWICWLVTPSVWWQMVVFGSFGVPWEQLGDSNKKVKMGCVSERLKKLNNTGNKSAYDFATSKYIIPYTSSVPLFPPNPEICTSWWAIRDLFCFLNVVPSSVTKSKCKELSWRSGKIMRDILRLETVKHYIGELHFILTLSPKFLCVCEILGISLKSCYSQVVPNCLCVFQFCYLLALCFVNVDLFCSNRNQQL